MTIPPESIEVGKCYLVNSAGTLHVRRVTRLIPDGRVQYESRTVRVRRAWRFGMLSLRDFASQAAREVPCDWTPEREG